MTSLADIRRRPTTTFRVTLKQKLILLEFSLFFKIEFSLLRIENQVTNNINLSTIKIEKW